MNIQELKDRIYKESMEAMYTSSVTIIFFVRDPYNHKDYITGQTFSNGNLIKTHLV